MNKPVLLVIFLCTLLSACAPEKTNVFSNSYHNTTAHYNAYFVAKEDILEIESIIRENHQWNYNLILPVFVPFDTTLATSYEAQIEHCIEKASLGIQIHKGSSWEDDSYILVGKARFYSLDYVNAIETFKYVNTKGKGDDERHEALVSLMRTFIESEEFNNAIAVSDYLKRENLNNRNLTDLYLTRGYLYQKREDLDNMVQNLIQAVPLMKDKKERSRINFIIGQIYQSLGFDAGAYDYYKKTLRNNPPYELAFYTKLNMAQVSQIGKSNDIKKVRKYFKSLLKDRKNEEYKDKIYYEMAQFEVRNGNLETGMEYYNSSIRSSVKNDRQKAHSYWELGKIYYDSLAEYETAQLYYDSTISFLPKDELEYQAIQDRLEVLSNFVTQLKIISTNDSLLNLASLSDQELNLFLDNYIAEQEAAEAKRREEEKKKKRQQEALAAQQLNNPFGSQQNTSFGDNNYDESSTWYFYNTVAVGKGRSQFKSNWGNRDLEDDWRRSTKTVSSDALTDDEESENNDSETKTKSKDNDEEEFKIDKEELISTIPKDTASQNTLLSEIETAMYNLGNIYNFDLNEPKNSVETFEGLLERFDSTEYKHEVWYELFLIYGDLDKMTKSEYYKNLLLNKAPKSIYAKLIINPNYEVESQIESEKLKAIYAEAYGKFKKGEFTEAIDLLNDGLRTHTDNDFIDNAQLLKILINGKSESVYKYEYELNNFIKTYSESELVPYVDSLVQASQQYQINLVNSTKAKFKERLNRPHSFIFVYEKDPQLSNILPEYFEEFALANNTNLDILNFILDDKYAMIMLTEFTDKKSAVAFNQLVIEEKPSEKINKSGKFYNFVITQENFDILYQTKELDTYLSFYHKNYPAK